MPEPSTAGSCRPCRHRDWRREEAARRTASLHWTDVDGANHVTLKIQGAPLGNEASTVEGVCLGQYELCQIGLRARVLVVHPKDDRAVAKVHLKKLRLIAELVTALNRPECRRVTQKAGPREALSHLLSPPGVTATEP